MKYTTQTFLDGKVTLYGGDNRDVLRDLPDNSIDSICTDPPYALVSIVKRFGGKNAKAANDNHVYSRASRGFMGKQWDTGEVAFSEVFWAECLRVLKPGGHVAAFSGTRNYHRMACAIEDAGFEIRDQLAWIYGSGFPKSHDVSKAIDRAAGAERAPGTQYIAPDGKARGVDLGIQGGAFAAGNSNYVAEKLVTMPATDAARQWEGWGTALKPSHEPIVLARKPLSEGTVAANVLEHGTGAINVDGCRVDAPGGKTAGGRGGSRGAVGWQPSAGFDITDGKGRWPANVVHDGSDEVVGCFPTTHTNANSAGPAKYNGTSDTTYGKYAPRPAKGQVSDSGSAARFFYSAKASKADRAGSKHPTVKPVALMSWLARLITPPGGTILDPFAGSGTTGEACRREGFRAVLIEREDEYVADIKRRMSTPACDTPPHVAAAVAAQQPANDNQPSPQADLFGKAA